MNLTVGVSAFARASGNTQRAVASINNVEELCKNSKLGLSLKELGCETFWQLSGSIDQFIRDSIKRTLDASSLSHNEIDGVIFATSDATIPEMGADLVRNILEPLNLNSALPTLISFQQCVSSLSALHYASFLISSGQSRNIIIVAFDRVSNDEERIRPYAFHGDAVSSCLVSQAGHASTFTLKSSAVCQDFEGICGRDSFASRKIVADRVRQRIVSPAGISLGQISKVFSTNFYRPLASYNAMSSGLKLEQLHINTLPVSAHCGNCDWMLNLMHHIEHQNLLRGEYVLVQAYGPGFLGSGVLQKS